MQLAHGVCGSSPTPPYICTSCVGFSPSYFSPQPLFLQASHLNTNSFLNTTSPAFSSSFTSNSSSASSPASSFSDQTSFLQASYLNTNPFPNTTSPASSSASSSSGQTSLLQATHLSTNSFGNTGSPGFSFPSYSSPQSSFLQASHLNTNSFPNTTSPAFSSASSPASGSSGQTSFLQASHLSTNSFPNTTSPAFRTASSSSSYQDTINPYQQHSPIKQETMSASNSDASGFLFYGMNSYGLPDPPHSTELNMAGHHGSAPIDGNHSSLDNAHLRMNGNHGLTNYNPSFAVDATTDATIDDSDEGMDDDDESMDDSDSQPSMFPQRPTAMDEDTFSYPEILDSVLENRDGKYTLDRQLVIAEILILVKENPDLPFPEFLLDAPDHNDKEARDTYLLVARWFKLDYKQIKKLGEFPVAEATLRGRHRVFIRPAEARPRKPVAWTEEQIRAMHLAKAKVEAYIDGMKAAKRAGQKVGPIPTFTWQRVGDCMREMGVSHRFNGGVIANQYRGGRGKKGKKSAQ